MSFHTQDSETSCITSKSCGIEFVVSVSFHLSTNDPTLSALATHKVVINHNRDEISSCIAHRSQLLL